MVGEPDLFAQPPRLCFANPEPETIKQGVAVLAEVCRREFGVPLRSANIDKR